MPAIRLRSGHDARLRHGHLWVFSNEILDDVSTLPAGGVVEVLDASGRFLGRGLSNPNSLISVRVCTRDVQDDLDSVDFYVKRIEAALDLRRRALPGRSSCRVFAGEADGLPGLILDRYEDIVAVQISALGLELRRPLLQEAIQRVLAPAGVVLRNEAGARALEGLPAERGVWWGEVPERVIFPAGFLPNGQPLRLYADVLGGQKTGFFFDQAENRAYGWRCSPGRRVLDVYANTGGWCVGALASGAIEATAIESNAETCQILQDNAALNDRGPVTVLAEDARDALSRLQGARFDLVFLDPPAFAKTRKKTPVALKAYREINRLALGALAPGGLLFTSSCSYHIFEDRFEAEVLAAAHEARRRLRQVRRGEQAPDHPVLPGHPETRYLKHLVYQAL